MSSKKSIVDLSIESIAESQDISIKDAAKQFMEASDHVVNFDDLPGQKHIWIDRGLKSTCENAGHPYHEAWKRRKATI